MEIITVEYSTQYNEQFRAITNKQITTVEISPTGSGKTHFYKNSPYTIMLMPTNAMVREHAGMLSEKVAKVGERSRWNEIRTDRCDYMTYDKFTGHLKHSDMSKFNIIIDEAHLVLSSDRDIDYELLETLFTRRKAYKELKLISATIRQEILHFYNDEGRIDAIRYIKKSFNPTVQFSTLIPPITANVRTLFFINSIDKMIQIAEHYTKEIPELRVLRIQSDKDMPDEAEFKKYDLILSTCYIQQGFSINCHIDQVIIHNVHNAVGAIGIIQYMARPRVNTPHIYVIPSTTHFTSNTVTEPEINKLIALVEGHTGSDEDYQLNMALEMDRLMFLAKQSSNGWNALGICHHYENMVKAVELYSKNAEGMSRTIKQMIPSATVIIKDVDDGIKLKLNQLDIKHITEDLKKCRNIDELHREIKLLLDEGQIERIDNKLKAYLKVKPICEFSLTDKNGKNKQVYDIKDHIQVLQVLDSDVKKRCSQHIKNTELAYPLIQNQRTRHLPVIGEVYSLGQMRKKLSFIKARFTIKDDPTGIKLISKLYSYISLDEKGKVVSQRSIHIHSIKITSLYPIEERWYAKVTKSYFLRVRKFISD